MCMWLGYLGEIQLSTTMSFKFIHITVCVRIYLFILGILTKAAFF